MNTAQILFAATTQCAVNFWPVVLLGVAGLVFAWREERSKAVATPVRSVEPRTLVSVVPVTTVGAVEHCGVRPDETLPDRNGSSETRVLTLVVARRAVSRLRHGRKLPDESDK